VIHGIVSFWRQYQASNGSILDPYALQEIQYSTPCFAFAASLMVTTGYDASFLDSAALALDSALSQLANATCASGHCNFFIFPSMMTFWALSPLVDAGRVAMWQGYLRGLDPAKTYVNLAGNWGLVAVGGEYLRTSVGGFGDPSWWQDLLQKQYTEGSQFTDNGEYQDHSGMDGLNPFPYSVFPNKYLTVMLRQGFANATTFGPIASDIAELMRRSAWTNLLIQSPWGEIPTGGRSSQHQWNEAASAAIDEITAQELAEAGDAAGACMFKRAAHLSLQSVARWVNESSGALFIVKNHFPPQLRWGYEVYSFFSQVGMRQRTAAQLRATALPDHEPDATCLAAPLGRVW